MRRFVCIYLIYVRIWVTIANCVNGSAEHLLLLNWDWFIDLLMWIMHSINLIGLIRFIVPSLVLGLYLKIWIIVYVLYIYKNIMQMCLCWLLTIENHLFFLILYINLPTRRPHAIWRASVRLAKRLRTTCFLSFLDLITFYQEQERAGAHQEGWDPMVWAPFKPKLPYIQRQSF